MKAELVTLLLIFCAAEARSVNSSSGDEGCIVNGTHYNPGQAYSCPDGCNQCVCLRNNISASTLLPCGCYANGILYLVGQSFLSSDGCNMCTCMTHNTALCTQMACPPDRCDLPCPRHWNPMCGSDGRTYGNECVFEEGQCRNPDLELAHEGVCDK